MIKTSVIIPVYNTGQYLEECIESVFCQTQKEIEVIAVNDGSTDESWEVLLHAKEKHPDLIIITQENHGLGYTRNIGMERAKGEYIYFLDSDDYILEDTLEKCYEYASKNKLDIVMFDAFSFEDTAERKAIEPNYDDRHAIIKERTEVFSGISFLENYYPTTYNPQACFVYCSAVFLRDNDIQFLKRVYFEDNEFHCRIMTLAERIMYLPIMFYQCRCRSGSITATAFDLRKADDHIAVVNAIAELRTLNEGKGWHVVRKISLNLLRYAASMCHSNHLYYEDSNLSRRVLETWIKICDCGIKDNKNLEDVNYIYRMSENFPNSDLCEEKKQIHSRRKQLLIQRFRQLPLQKNGCKVAIYGCGRYTDNFLKLYEEWVGEIQAEIIFLDSYIKEKNVKYKGCFVYNISEIEEKEPDYILISSSIYDEEMSNNVQKFYGDRFEIVKLYSDLHIDI